MKIRHLLLSAAALLAASCVTTTAPDGTVTRAPDAPTVSAAGGVIQALAGLFAPAPRVEPVSGK